MKTDKNTTSQRDGFIWSALEMAVRERRSGLVLRVKTLEMERDASPIPMREMADVKGQEAA